MPLDVARLLDSDLYAISTGDEFKAAVSLWCKSWMQTPAASLPNSEKVLAYLSGAGSKWPKVKKAALHGWILCSDDRWYHPTVAEKALGALPMRQMFKDRQSADADRKAKERADRKHLFAFLRENGIVPEYDMATKKLRDMATKLRDRSQDEATANDETSHGRGCDMSQDNCDTSRDHTNQSRDVSRLREGEGEGEGHKKETSLRSERADDFNDLNEAVLSRVIVPVTSPPQPLSLVLEADTPVAARRSPAPKGSRLPATWVPRPAEIAYAADKGVNVALAEDEFKNFWWSTSKNAAKLDWDRTFHNRITELAEQGKFRVQPGSRIAPSPANPTGRAVTPVSGGF